MPRKTTAQVKREQIRSEFWKKEIPWEGADEVGWFTAPRSMALIMALVASKAVSGNADPTMVYLDLLARHRDTGIVEMVGERQHSYSSGYWSTRGVRTWRENMKLLEKLGFIKVLMSGNNSYGHVLLVHPVIAIEGLRKQGKIPDIWWKTYRQCQIDAKEHDYEAVSARIPPEIKTKPKKKAPKR